MDVDHLRVIAADDAAGVGEAAGGERQVDVEEEVERLRAGVVDGVPLVAATMRRV